MARNAPARIVQLRDELARLATLSTRRDLMQSEVDIYRRLSREVINLPEAPNQTMFTVPWVPMLKVHDTVTGRQLPGYIVRMVLLVATYMHEQDSVYLNELRRWLRAVVDSWPEAIGRSPNELEMWVDNAVYIAQEFAFLVPEPLGEA